MHRIKDAIQLVEMYNSKHNPQTQLHGLDALQVLHNFTLFRRDLENQRAL